MEIVTRLSRLLPTTTTQYINLLVVSLCSLFVLSQLQPSLLLIDTTAAGGDMGAHVWAPNYLREHLLPDLRLTGWTPDWYNGFPALTFYFPLPTVVIALLSYVIPANIAFKLVAVSGLVTLPWAVFFFGRKAKVPFPIPACMAAASVLFLFDTGYSILGGNIASTLAGEFALSVGLSLAFLFLGVVAGGLETNRQRATAILLLGAVILSHILATILALVGGVILFLISLAAANKEKSFFTRRFWWGAPVVFFGCLVSAFWAIPFIWNRHFLNDMGWEKIGTGVESGLKLYDQSVVNYSDALLQNPPPLLVLAGFAGAALSLFLRRRMGLFWVLVATASAAAFALMPQAALWNARILPFYYLSLYMLGAVLLGEIGVFFADLAKRRPEESDLSAFSRGMANATPIAAFLIAFLLTAATLPAPVWWPTNYATSSTEIAGVDIFDRAGDRVLGGVWHDPAEAGGSYIPGWAEWNFSGYQRKAAYPEYQQVVQAMAEIGQVNGCGRAMWEYESKLDRFGTPMALMLLPMWTDRCIGSQEGLYFESSSSVPYHFMNQAELSKGPSSAMRNLPYPSLNVAGGVDKLQLLGVRYYMAITAEAQAQADMDSRLTLLRTVPAAPDDSGQNREWKIYQVAESDPVVGLDALPAVMTDPASVEPGFTLNSGEVDEANAWLANSVPWYRDAAPDKVLLAEDGPATWPRQTNANEDPFRVEIEPTEVTNIVMGDDSIDFDVAEVGKPVLVKTSYFPNWNVEGAEGPYRVTPNLMVVVPTAKHVSMGYGRSAADWIGFLGTLIGLGAALFFARHDRRQSAVRSDDALDVGNVVAQMKEREATAPATSGNHDDTVVDPNGGAVGAIEGHGIAAPPQSDEADHTPPAGKATSEDTTSSDELSDASGDPAEPVGSADSTDEKKK